MAWTEIVATFWSALFVISVAIVTHNQEQPSRLAGAALGFAAGLVLALFGVALRGFLSAGHFTARGHRDGWFQFKYK
jgi:hypothetical protein